MAAPEADPVDAPAAEVGAAVRPYIDGRIAAYLFVVIAALVAGLAVGQPAVVALAAVVTPLLVIGLIHASSARFAAVARFSPEQVVEGDPVDLTIELHGPQWAYIQLKLKLPSGLRDAGAPAGAPGTRLTALVEPGERPAFVTWRLNADGWGRHELGDLLIDASPATGLLGWRASLPVPASLRVLPSAPRVDELLAPSATRITHGSHLARRLISHGSEFAEIRPYQPGDRLRDLNWAATARRREPHVNRHHPELAGEVVLLVDTHGDNSRGLSTLREGALLHCTRAAWSIAQLHLAAQDRVGLLAQGERMVWLEPKGGSRAKYQMLEALLAVSGGEHKQQAWMWGREASDLIPASALVVVLTPLWNDRLVYAVARLKARGRSVAVLALDPREVLGTPADADEELLHRLFALSVTTRRRSLVRAGVPVVDWHIGGIEAALAGAVHVSRGMRSGGRGR